jgi:folate-binding Fe-S cluster repair protein YgfZ/thioredoxin-like negative regulator of GroEL
MNALELMSELEGASVSLADYSVLEVTGIDRERFLSGQTTNEIVALSCGEFVLNSRLDRAGKLQSFFYQMKGEEQDFLIVPKQSAAHLCEDLEKYIIMDEVEISVSEKSATLIFTSFKNPLVEYGIDQDAYKGAFAFLPAVITLESEKLKSKTPRLLEMDYFNLLCLVRGVPLIGLTAKMGQLVTDTVVNLCGVSLSKGCFLGQETVAKIETRRGGAYLPVALKHDRSSSFQTGEKIYIDGKSAGHVIKDTSFGGENILVASLLRDFRIEKKAFKVSIGSEILSCEVNYLPLGGGFEREEYIQYLYENAVSTFQKVGNVEGIEAFKEVLKVDPAHEDSLESMGVIFGRMEKFEEGIDLMSQVLETNPDSIMAHTNKSLFFMRLGKIEEAEEEKAQATVKSFASFGKVANDKRAAEKKAQEEEAEMNRRMDMFKQVLELDPEDELANYGMADVYHAKDNAKEAIPLLEKVLEVNEKYSVAYLLLGKCYLKENLNEEAKATLEKGIGVASKLGDLMPANEMQNILSRL